MTNDEGPAKRAKNRAQNLFNKVDQRDALWRQEKEKARLADVAKTARLKALRLARDAAEAAEKAQSEDAGDTVKPTVRKVRRRRIIA